MSLRMSLANCATEKGYYFSRESSMPSKSVSLEVLQSKTKAREMPIDETSTWLAPGRGWMRLRLIRPGEKVRSRQRYTGRNVDLLYASSHRHKDQAAHLDSA